MGGLKVFVYWVKDEIRSSLISPLKGFIALNWL